MRFFAVTVGLFGFAAWDIGTQHGAVTRPAVAAMTQTIRALGLM